MQVLLVLVLGLQPRITAPDGSLSSSELLNEGRGGERAAAGCKALEVLTHVDLWTLASAAPWCFTCSSHLCQEALHACARRDRRLHVCRQDGRINTSGCCVRCQTVCGRTRRQHGPTEAGHLQLWVSFPLTYSALWASENILFQTQRTMQDVKVISVIYSLQDHLVVLKIKHHFWMLAQDKLL